MGTLCGHSERATARRTFVTQMPLGIGLLAWLVNRVYAPNWYWKYASRFVKARATPVIGQRQIVVYAIAASEPAEANVRRRVMLHSQPR